MQTNNFFSKCANPALVIATLQSEGARIAATGECMAAGCDVELTGDYPMCGEHRKTRHFTHRLCLCTACESERASDIRLVDGDAGKLVDLLDEREELRKAA